MSALLAFPNAYERDYSTYQALHETTQASWRKECEFALAWKKSKTWEQAPLWTEQPNLPKNFENFCHHCLPYEYSTYRAYRIEAPYADLIQEVFGQALTAYDCRQLREKIQKQIGDKRLTFDVLKHAYQLDSSAIVPSTSVVNAVYNVLKLEEKTGAVDIEGQSVNLRDTAKLVAMQRELEEIKGRQNSHIEQSTGQARKSLKIEKIAPFLDFAKSQGLDLSEIDFDSIEGGSLIVYQRIKP